ncbi:MAG TPA: isoaspartyl peptidase/L-asparaginase [Bacteroidales bacterium]|nr:isoaspartyl peptidase/L-asparaginase [Bacteroidales bacterium]
MKRIHLLIILFLLAGLSLWGQNTGMETVVSMNPWVLVIQGGAGGPPQGTYTPEKEMEYRKVLEQALQAGAAILRNEGSSVDAVEAAIRVMEDSPLFNAGKGAVLDEDGKVGLDASIMDGKTLMAGAVADVTTIKNPISAARRVMTNSSHVLLVDGGAEKFAKEQGLEIVDPSYFITDQRLKDWQKSHEQKAVPKQEEKKPGTVGAVALDQAGNLAAGTSTGGMMNKKQGRVGDSPIIGAGTYANNNTCAVSATGHGEFFMRNVVAYDLSALMEYKGMSLQQAADYIITDKLKKQGGDGGLIAVDKNGNIAMPFNTQAMFRGYMNSQGQIEIQLY